MIKTYTDKITQKVITYKDTSLFTIETRSKFNARIVKKVFQSSDIQQALDEFYALIIADGHYKYLYMRPLDKSESETLILRMKGYASQVAIEKIVLRDDRPKGKMKTASIANLTSCPLSLANKLASDDRDQYPVSISRWSTSKLVYSLLAYVMSLPNEEKLKVLREADRQLLIHKELSGFSLEEESLIKVDVVTKDDLL
jgi:hypothetical protein